MIAVERPAQAPAVLLGAGRDETNLNCEAYDADEDAYRAGSNRFDFNRNIYAHGSVKEALLLAQHHKCCYCERKVPASSHGAVEHFRPKGAVRAGRGLPNRYPGYYWLAYRWENLLVSCEKCNTIKGALFPLVDEETRALCHHDSVEDETPVFIDPAGEDPADHIRFRRAEVEHLTDSGLGTIEGFGLRRSALEDARAERLAWVEGIFLLISKLDGRAPPADIDHARSLLDEASRPEAEFSAMTRDFLDLYADGVDAD